MNTGWLQDFLAVAEFGNFTRAAHMRNASQAAFSRRIIALEAWLGVKLIDRSVFPTRLTAEGERFRERAVEIIGQISEARIELSGRTPTRDQVRIALPHSLATGKLGDWCAEWERTCATRHAITTGNIHDMVTALVAGGVDLLICFHNAQQPLHLAPDQYERVVVGVEQLRPYASPTFIKSLGGDWLGTARRPTPVLMYSPGAYLARMVDLIHESASVPFHGVKVADSDMADVLRAIAVAGSGVAWLPDCTALQAPADSLVALGDAAWTLPLSIVAYRDRAVKRAAVQRLWSHLESRSLPARRTYGTVVSDTTS